jgi:2-keto-4-pentenoate hydratase/2-oxohepta-3-ene-1,7-dioic acid hydratase in catechol pathway
MFDDYRPGALAGSEIIDLSEAAGAAIMSLPGPDRMTHLIADYERLQEGFLAALARQRPAGQVILRAPVPRPGKMLFAAANYNEGLSGITFPIDMFLKSPSAILDPGGTVELPSHDAQLFFHEAELGVVIGRSAHRVPADQALRYVFGYTAIIDVSSYGLPGQIGGIRSKSFDTFCPIGPCIAEADEIADPQDLVIRLWIDGQLRQDYSTSDMEHPVSELIEFASHVMTLHPGDVLSCGTSHAGLGPIQDGETMRIDIEAVGGYEVRVSDPRGRRWPSGPDPAIEAGAIQLKTTGIAPDTYFQVRPVNEPFPKGGRTS